MNEDIEDAERLVRFLTRKLPPCNSRYEGEDACGGTLLPMLFGRPSDVFVRAVYRCQDCDATWDHDGQPLRKRYTGAP